MSASVTDFGLTRDGLAQLRRRWSAPAPWAVALLLHGIAEHSGRYEHVGAQLSASGIYTVAIDHRGFGQSGGKQAYVQSFDQFLGDVEDQLAEIRRLDLPVVLIGHSMGGLIACSYATSDRPQPDLLVLSGPALGASIPAPIRAITPVLAKLLPRLRFPNPIRPATLSTDPLVGEAYLADPLVRSFTTPALGWAMLREMRRCNAELARLRVPTLVLHGADDELVPSRFSQPLAGIPGVERRALSGLRHEIFNEPNRGETIDSVIGWIRGRLTKSPQSSVNS